MKSENFPFHFIILDFPSPRTAMENLRQLNNLATHENQTNYVTTLNSSDDFLVFRIEWESTGWSFVAYRLL